ncbi:alpha/beta hydrolase [Geodermatophilus sp. YIM 151500]|uniref:alpha/beta fold hydrolase n=1 Tax=Geodermatophilus sp. YIM 151500 TaxID=2984531 RepID=UPI0021E51538|nr:alpha/beta hydrolase [Geodermatophilus sp. YIM 151500]MCV2489226.1 alpha/beta hydrolase [Geodermatophilus sp. YIM 151500]
MATFVIVHGAWSGAHAWRWVRPLLRDAGHEVFTPSLTGLGERAHLAHPGIDLDTHVEDVVAVLRYEDLRDVVLVGHSYGGMVISGVADRERDRLAQLVYLDADVPLDGQSEFDLLEPEEAAEYAAAARSRGDGWRIPPPFPDPLPPGLPAAVAWTVARMVPHPLRTLTQPLHLVDDAAVEPPRTYVLCSEGKHGQPVPAYVQRISADPQWRVIEVEAGHAAHVTAPEALVGTLVEIATS